MSTGAATASLVADRQTAAAILARLDRLLATRHIRRDATTIELPGSEFKILEYFMRRPDRLVTRAMLLEDVWR